MFSIDSGLHVVARRKLPSNLHETRLWLRVALELFQSLGHRTLIDLHFVLFVGSLQLIQIALQRFALANPIHTTHRLELRTIDRDPLATHQAQGLREPHKFRASFGHRLAMHPPELSDRLVIGNQPAQQPHHFHIALALSFQPARGPNLPQGPVQIQFQQIARVVTRTSSFSRFGANETQLRHVQPTHKRLDYTADMILWHQIVQGRWKQGVLTTLLAFDISLSAMPSFARIFASLFSDPQWVS